MSDDKGAESEQLWSAEAQLARLRRSFETTGNPVDVWSAIAVIAQSAGYVGDFAVRLRPLGEGGDGPEQQHSLAELAAVPLPGWCLQYLAQTAENLEKLLRGHDFRVPRVGQDPDSYDQWLRQSRISLQQSVALVPAALGIVRKGWNAFAAFRSTAFKMGLALWHDNLRAEGMSSKAAIEKTWSFASVADERSYRRKLAEGRKLASKAVGKGGKGTKPGA